MNSFEDLFDEAMVGNISNFIESKMELLNQVKDFKEKDKKLSECMEELDNELSDELREKFDNVIRLTYQLEEYYFTLAYLLGTKYGEQMNKL